MADKQTKTKSGPASGGTITVEQVRSANRKPDIQRQTLVGLGLNKMHRRKTLKDTPEVRGMIAKIPHLVRVVDEN